MLRVYLVSSLTTEYRLPGVAATFDIIICQKHKECLTVTQLHGEMVTHTLKGARVTNQNSGPRFLPSIVNCVHSYWRQCVK